MENAYNVRGDLCPHHVGPSDSVPDPAEGRQLQTGAGAGPRWKREVLLSQGSQAQSADAHSQHLAWVHEAFGIQRGLELLHGLHAHVAHLLLQQLPLAQPNAMLPGTCSVER